MLRDLSTRKKLLILPIIFICIFILSASVFSYFHNQSEKKEMIVSQTDSFIQQVLKGRISVYQFLRSPTEDNKQKTIAIFESLNKTVTDIKSTLSVQKRRQIIEVTIPFNGVILRGEESTSDMYKSLDLVEDKLERKIRKQKCLFCRIIRSK